MIVRPRTSLSVRVAIAKLGELGMTTIDVTVLLNSARGIGLTDALRRLFESTGGTIACHRVALVKLPGGHWPPSGFTWQRGVSAVAKHSGLAPEAPDGFGTQGASA